MARISFSYFVEDIVNPSTGKVVSQKIRPIIPIRLSIHRGNPTNHVNAYPSQVNIWVNDKKYKTDADFSPVQQIPLLGRSGFFNLFKEVIFDENRQYLHIEL